MLLKKISSISKEKEETFCNAYEYIFGEIVSRCKKFPTKVGSLDQSFTVLFYTAQIDKNKVITTCNDET